MIKVNDILIRNISGNYSFVRVKAVTPTAIRVEGMFTGDIIEYELTGWEFGALATREKCPDLLYAYDYPDAIEMHLQQCLDNLMAHYRKQIRLKFNSLIVKYNTYEELQEFANDLQFYDKPGVI